MNMLFLKSMLAAFCLFFVAAGYAQSADGPTASPCSNTGPCPKDCESDCCPSGGGGPGGGKGANMISNPVSTASGYKVEEIVDFSVNTLRGVPLEVQRNYSSSGFGYTGFNNNGDTLFGPNWYSSFEANLGYQDLTMHGGSEYFVFINGEGDSFHFDQVCTGCPTDTYFSREDQGEPLKLTVTGTGTGKTFKVHGPGYTTHLFDYNGRLLEIDYNTLTFAAETLTFTYDGSDRLWKVQSPDDRYLEFVYQTSGNTKRAKEIYLKTATESFLIGSYQYLGPGSRLSHAMVRQVDGETVETVYEYGSFDLVSGTPVWTSGSRLGRTSRKRDTTTYPLSAYKYHGVPSDPLLWNIQNAVSKIFTWDPSVSGTMKWVQTHTLDSEMWIHTPTIYFADTEDAGAPQFGLVSNFKLEIQDVVYANHTKDASFSGGSGNEISNYHATVPSGGNGEGKPKVGFGLEVLDGSGGVLYPIVEHEYDLTNTDVTLRHRRTKTTRYSSSSSTSAMETNYTYDSTFARLVKKVVNPEGEESETVYHNLFSDATSHQYRYGRINKTIGADGRETAFTYYTSGSTSGLLHKIIDDDGNETIYAYNSRGDVTSTTYPDGKVSTMTYDAFGNVLTSTVTNIGTTTYVYSNATYLSDGTTSVPSGEFYLPPRLVEVRDPDGAKTRYFYEPFGNIKEIRDANNISTFNYYDDRLRLVETENGEGESVFYTYDREGRLTKFTDGRGKETSYIYDSMGRIIRETDHDGHYRAYRYVGDQTGGCGCAGGGSDAVARVRREDGTFVAMTYDVAGRLTGVNYEGIGGTGSNELVYTYDKAGRVLSVEDTRLTLAGNKTYSFTYDVGATGRLEKVTHPEGYTQEYFFQDNPANLHYRRIAAYKNVDGHVTKYAYDSLGRLDTLTDSYAADTAWTYATTSDTAYPVGAVKRVTYGNNTKNEYSYDSLGRLERLDYLPGTGGAFDYIELAYDPVGMITDKERKDGSSHFTTHYDYDDAYRLVDEENRDDTDTPVSGRTYTYDAGGNRTWMTQWNDAAVNKTTQFAYGNRNQLLTSDGYYHTATTTTGSVGYTWDSRGNMQTRNGQNYYWNEDNRLTEAWVSGGDPKVELFKKYFKYDNAGRRILEHKGTTGQRTRHFFSGLTEEIKKVSLNTHADASSGRLIQADGDGNLDSNFGTASYDADRFSKVYDATMSVTRTTGTTYFGSGNGLDITDRTTFSAWLKSGHANAYIRVSVTDTSGNRRGLMYQNTTGSMFIQTNLVRHRLGGTAQDFFNPGRWVRLERDLQRDLAAAFPGSTLARITGVELGTEGQNTTIYMDDLTFSNSLTVEHNTLGGGVIGHILRNRSTNSTTYDVLDRWFHYDQVGSVMSESGSAGTLLTKNIQDAFGNSLNDWSSGLWGGGNRSGWHHNTKEYDADTGLVYMYQRWYLPETGTFVSKAPYPPMREHSYSFAEQNPVLSYDPDGREYTLKELKWRNKNNKCPKKKPCPGPPGKWCSEGASKAHPGAAECFRQVVPLSWTKPISGSQCCYDANGKLITLPPGAGTYDLVAPATGVNGDGTCANGIVRIVPHFYVDVIPWVFGSAVEASSTFTPPLTDVDPAFTF